MVEKIFYVGDAPLFDIWTLAVSEKWANSAHELHDTIVTYEYFVARLNATYKFAKWIKIPGSIDGYYAVKMQAEESKELTAFMLFYIPLSETQ